MKQILSKSVVLIGLMGTGKSTVGRTLSKQLGVLFSDSDKKIEQLSGKSVEKIFKESGEAHFRSLEEKVFCDLFERDPHIISSGGGTILSARSRQFIADCSYSIWLKSDREKILSRIKKRSERPLISRGNPKNILKQKLIERKKFYNKADFHLENADISIQALITQIIEKLKKEKVLTYG
tara:strand:- start:9 stop:548 length:540 start_codon:yes stop_codon:yes gene_type:complete